MTAIAGTSCVAGVQSVRGAAARTDCQNNLHQIGLGLHTYATARGTLPPGVSSGKSEKFPYPLMGWQTRLLPYVEQQALWEESERAFQADPNFDVVPPHTAQQHVVKVYGCPMDSRARTLQTYGGSARGMTSYLGVNGLGAGKNDGVLFLDSAVRLTDITDGTSNTLMVGERPPSTDLRFGWWYAGIGQDGRGDIDMTLGVRTLRRPHVFPKCTDVPYYFSVSHFHDECGAFHFWSPHFGGAHFALADGSVRFVSYSADPFMPALASRAGGELAGGLD